MPETNDLHVPNWDLFQSDDRSDAFRLRRLIEGRRMLMKRYDVAYGGVADTLQQVRDVSHPSLARLSTEQLADLEASLVSARDQVARGFSGAIARAENDANELSPGTFPVGDEPFQSFDLGEWFKDVLDAVKEILEGLGDLFDAFGWDAGADAADAAAGALDDLGDYGKEQGWWTDEDDDD